MTEKLRDLALETDDLDLSVRGAKIELQVKYKDLVSPCSQIINPANPANNLYDTGARSKISEVYTSFGVLAQGVRLSAEDARRAVDELVTITEENFKGFNISEIIKTGSMGHGTAVPSQLFKLHTDIETLAVREGLG